jgi:hypothetical protein
MNKREAKIEALEILAVVAGSHFDTGALVDYSDEDGLRVEAAMKELASSLRERAAKLSAGTRRNRTVHMVCSVCKRNIRLTKAGYFRRHMSAPGIVCAGSWKYPVH